MNGKGFLYNICEGFHTFLSIDHSMLHIYELQELNKNESKIQNDDLQLLVKISPAWYRQLCSLGKPQFVGDNEEKIFVKSVHQFMIASCLIESSLTNLILLFNYYNYLKVF